MFYSTNKLSDIKKEAVLKLKGLYSQREAENMLNLLIHHYFNMTRAGQQLHPDKRLSESEMLLLHIAVKRLLNAEPLQYILGSTEFYGLQLEVGPEVLIPRPETEELVDIIIKETPNENLSVLDIGTGSGCIALALKSVLTLNRITAVDVSEQALAVARKNALKMNIDVDFRQCDIMNTTECLQVLPGNFQVIVSNPPYVLKQEKVQMSDNVLEYEPYLALFVENDDPLVFYRKIILLAKKVLHSGGKIYCELNENYAKETASLFDEDIFDIPEILKDIHGKNRFLVTRMH